MNAAEHDLTRTVMMRDSFRRFYRMPDRAPTWLDLLRRLQQLRDSGKPIRDTDGEFIRTASRSPDVPFVRIFPVDATDMLAAWIRDMEERLIIERRLGVLARVDRLLAEHSATTLPRVLHLSLTSFAPPPELDDGEPCFDMHLAREGFDLLIAALLEEAEALVHAPTVPEEKAPEYWTPADLARFHGVRVKTIIKQISYHRNKHGQDPDWVRRFPGKQRGFRVHRPTYMAMMARAYVRAPRSRRATQSV